MGKVAKPPERADIDDVSRVPKHVKKDAENWVRWRIANPVRANDGEGPLRSILVQKKPTKNTQAAWYSFRQPDHQEWLYAPFLIAAGGSKCLTGAPPEADLRQVRHEGQRKEHYSNIWRMEQLLTTHP